MLDSIEPNRPIRIQHRSGRLWTFNSLAISRLSVLPAAARIHSNRYPELQITAEGHLFDQDRALGERLQMLTGATIDSQAVSEVSKSLSKLGVTGLHDMTPSNGMQEFDWFDSYKQTGNSAETLSVGHHRPSQARTNALAGNRWREIPSPRTRATGSSRVDRTR